MIRHKAIHMIKIELQTLLAQISSDVQFPP